MASFERCFGTNKKLEEEGIWQTLDGGLQVLVARINNKRYRDLLRKRVEQYRRQHRSRVVPDDAFEKIGNECIADAVLLDWKGAEFEGKPIEYTRDGALDMLTRYPEFQKAILEISTDMKLYQDEAEEEATKN